MKKLLFVLIGLLVAGAVAGAQTSKQTAKESAKTTILQTVVVPDGATIYEGTTRGGNPKFWVTLKLGDQTVDVTVSESLAAKHKAGTAKIEIVKRKDNTTGRISYSSRTLGGRTSKPTTDINLNNAKFN